MSIRCQHVATFLGTMVTEICYSCKVPFAMSLETYNTLQKGGTKLSFCCPFGHQQHYCDGETESDKLRRELARKTQENARLHDEAREEREKREAAERSVAAQKGNVTRLKNRAANGVCPCCSRSFTNLHRHMTTQHPDFTKQDAA